MNEGERMNVQVAFQSNDTLGEGPVWVPEEQALYWVDILRPALQRWHPESGDYLYWKMPSEIGCFALREKGGAVLALKDGFAFLDFGNSMIDLIFNPESNQPYTRFNDGKCDRRGRFWAGTMDEDGKNFRGSLYRLNSFQEYHQIISGIGTSNGLGWSPDNRVMYYTDSKKRTIWVYDFDLESGAISNQHVFVTTPTDYIPDGLTVDAEGYVWSAKWDGWKVVRYAPDGSVDLEINLPVQRPTSCVFGGSDLTDLYITSASTGLSRAELAEQPLAGCIFIVESGTKGLLEPRFAG